MTRALLAGFAVGACPPPPSPTQPARGTPPAGGGTAASTHIGTTLGDVVHLDAFGAYAPAVARWETILGRPAPDPDGTLW